MGIVSWVKSLTRAPDQEPASPQVFRRRVHEQPAETPAVTASTASPDGIRVEIAPPQVIRHYARSHPDEPTPSPSLARNSITIGEMQTQGMPKSLANDDIIKGWRFCATMQLRTPLRVLRFHNRVVEGTRRPPPNTVKEQWEGIWIPQTKTWKELGIDVPELPPMTMASAVGYIPEDGGNYLRFLIAVRQVAETPDPMDRRITALRQLLADPKWSEFVDKRAVDGIVDELFPRFVNTIPGINDATAEELRKLALDTPARLAAASDKALLAVKGIGPARLRKIREYCERVTDNRDLDRIDTVKR